MKALVGNPSTGAPAPRCGLRHADAGGCRPGHGGALEHRQGPRAAEGSRLRQHARADAACHRRGLAVAAAGGQPRRCARPASTSRWRPWTGRAWPRARVQGAAADGGWSILNTNMYTADLADPVRTPMAAADGDKAWYGWPDFPQVEAARPVRAKLGPGRTEADRRRAAARGHRRRPVRAVGAEHAVAGVFQQVLRTAVGAGPGVLGVDKTPERRAATVSRTRLRAGPAAHSLFPHWRQHALAIGNDQA